MIKGIDIYSGTGDLTSAILAAENPAFVIIKVSQGTWYRNPIAGRQLADARAANLRVGYYHYGEPPYNSGAAEARYMMDTIGLLGGLEKGDFLALDIEYGENRGENDLSPTADLKAYTLDFLQTWRAATALRPLVYSNQSYLESHNVYGPDLTTDYRLWLAAWQQQTPSPVKDWTDLIWQYDTSGVDRDYLLSDSLTALDPYSWGDQPDPLAGQVVYGKTDVDGDVPTILHHIQDLLNVPSPDLATVRADVALARTKFGLVT